MSIDAVTPVVPPPVAVAEDEPQSAGTEAVATVESTKDALVERIAVLWTDNKTNRFELGKTLFELQELYAVPGHGDFLERVKGLGIPKSTAYSLIGHYKREAGLSKPETDDDDDLEEPQKSKNEKVVVHLVTADKTKWDLALDDISRIRGVNKDEAALHAVLETAERLTHPDALYQDDVLPTKPAQHEEELEELL
jgi:hypothetical protein